MNKKCAATKVRFHADVTRKTCVLLRIIEKIFPQGCDRNVVFKICNSKTKESFKMAALELFQRENLLKQFDALDVREISYAAAWEMFLQEKEAIQSLHVKN